MAVNFNQASNYTPDKKFIFGTGNGAIEIADTVSLPNRFKSKMIFDNFRLFYQKVFLVKKIPL